MDEKINAITLKSTDYRENDKLLWLYSAGGKICVIAKGVKKAGAKLKFAAEPFCFGEFTLSSAGGRYVLTGCSQIESFFDLRSGLEKYYAGCVMLDAVSRFEEKDANPPVFLLLLKSLQSLLSQSSGLVLLKFMLDFLEKSGYRAELDGCNQCGSTNFDKLFYDSSFESFVCPACRTAQSQLLSPPVLSTLKMTEKIPLEKITVIKVKDEYIKQALAVLGLYAAPRISKLKSLDHFLSL